MFVPYSLLKQKNIYFRNLSSEAQVRFVERMYRFMEDKYFVGREGLVITDEIRVLISASAIQLTFGLKEYTISHLHTINVFPKAFYSRLFETSFKGLTTQGGVISLSWEDFREGYSVDDDKMNLGLHELAHALNIELAGGRFDDHFLLHFEKWKLVAVEDFKRLKFGGISFLRRYGSRNLHEFFAVCIEHFFEAPAQFKVELPYLYGHTALMLNQDPDNSDQDYKVRTVTEYFGGSEFTEKPDSPETSVDALIFNRNNQDSKAENALTFKEIILKYVSVNGLYIAMITTFVGLFIGIPTLIWFSTVTIVSVGTLLMLIFACGTLGLLQWKFVKDHLDMEYHHFAMYAFSGFAMCFLNFLLFLNLTVPIKDRTETYDLNSFRVNIYKGSIEVAFDDAALSRNLNTFLSDHFVEIPDATQMTVKYSTGLLGFDTIEECTFH